MDLNQIAEKWQKRWAEARIFQADADSKKKKFFSHFTYPYVNAYPHIGHFYTLMQAEIMARYKRLRGFNVLMPQGWHATGSPLVSAAKRVQEKEPKQLRILADMGINDEKVIRKFEKPEYWVEFFAPEFRKDFDRMGISIDWRRNYITTSLNPYYDKFIRWQFRKLKEKDYVVKGRFPVVWCPKDNVPVGDHDRVEGEGETPQEFIVMKYKFGDKFIAAATLRPETVFGDTNIWVNPDIEYVIAKVDHEKWIISKECAEKLKQHEKKVMIESKISGRALVGKDCRAPVTNKELLILPSSICDPNIATGIVRSVPSHAPFDWAALNDLQNSRVECEKYRLDFEEIKKIKPIAMIKVEGIGEHPAIEFAKKFGAKSQKDKEQLEKATQEDYKKEFFSGIMKDNTGKYANMKVATAKEEIKLDMLNANQAALMYELTGRVVCRCLTPSTIKIVSDQWFIAYGNKKWKKSAHDALRKLKIYPDKSRQQLEYTIDWLRNWACTREEGLGTRLPWDEKWLIESLSDSTIYFAYYPIAHLIKNVNPELIDDAFFDYVLLGEGKKPKIRDIEKMRKEFDYWYPIDFNTSGKDLIQNHIAFSLFNHSAVFPEDKWMAGIRINGWVTINGQKMSKSLGNIILLRYIAKEFSPDPARLTIASGGEGLDDPNWDSEFAKSNRDRLMQLYEFCISHYNKGGNKYGNAEKWLESQLNQCIQQTGELMDKSMFRSALQSCYFELQKKLKKYVKMAKGNPNKRLVNKAIESVIVMLSPFAPHTCEEMWEKIGKKGFVSLAKWPEHDAKKIDLKMNFMEDVIEDTKKDIYSILKLSKIEKPSKISLFIAEPWKYRFFKILKDELESTKEIQKIMKKIMATELKKYGNEISRMLPKLIQDPPKIQEFIFDQRSEIEMFNEAVEMYKEEIKAEFEVAKAESSKEQKARQALPSKPAILIT